MTRTLCYQFPLRPDYLVQLVLPTDMTQREAARLCAFVQSLATTHVLALPKQFQAIPTREQP